MKNAGNYRDINLDYFRGLIMMYIIGVIHVLYWPNVISNSYKSFFLVEMPIIFFITGASNSLKEYKLKEFYISRIKRILIPYFSYSLVCYVIIILYNTYIMHNANKDTIFNLKLLLSWLNPFGSHETSLPFISWHVWFIPIYLIIMILYPYLKYLYKNSTEKFKYIPFIIIIIIIFYLDRNKNIKWYEYIKETVFYTFWVYLGLFYKDINLINIKKVKLACLSVLSLLITFLLIKYQGYSYDMQINKFPPNSVFLFYNIGCFSILILIKDYIVKIVKIPLLRRIVTLYSKYGYTMYLYQVFSFMILDIFLKHFKINIILHHKFLLLLFYSSGVITIGLIYPKIFGFFETKSSSKFTLIDIIKNIFRKNIFEITLVLLSLIILVAMGILIKPERYGDGFEYIYMVQAFQNHFTPNITNSDIIAAQSFLRDNNILQFPDPYSGFFKSFSGKMYSYHFWFYSLVNVPIKVILEFLDINQFRCFQITNATLFIFSIVFAYKYLNMSEQKRRYVALLLMINPILWYLRWTHPEVFCYSLVIISLTLFTRSKFKLAIFVSAIASMQNPPIIFLSLIYIIKYFHTNYRKFNAKDVCITLLSCFPIVVPSLFYLYNFGTPNLIVREGFASIKEISIQRVYDIFFDMNMGMIFYIPIVVILFFVCIYLCIKSRNYKQLIYPICILIMVLFSCETTNWNHGCAGINRYSTWMMPIIIFFIINSIHIDKIIIKILLIIAIIYQGSMFYNYGAFICNISYLDLTPLAKITLNNFPVLYSPDFETFGERVLNKETTFTDKTPIVYADKTSVSKILTNYSGLYNIEVYFNKFDKDYYESILNKYKIYKNDDTKLFYINVPKDVLSYDRMEYRPILNGGFKVQLDVLDNIKNMKKNTNKNIKIKSVNNSKVTWVNNGINSGKHTISLSYHWLNTNGEMVIHDGVRTNLPMIIKPSSPILTEMQIAAPEVIGKYILEIDLVQEEVTWFKDKGNKTIRIPVEITN
ncbi:acyltransferase [Clostridium sp. DJ247]|uniref:acyltransferase family protein n=1 Tax=Clostridium sp. DJ247 TaxID=2726188 RepID=UPI00162AC3E9|nr:acyltransferase [Clostridium sp. DJ247]MBC2581570.1 acyltransferase [Clostridium sp. DJ247]